MNEVITITLKQNDYSGNSFDIEARVEVTDGEVHNIICWDGDFSGDWHTGDLADCQDAYDQMILNQSQTLDTRRKVG